MSRREFRDSNAAGVMRALVEVVNVVTRLDEERERTLAEIAANKQNAEHNGFNEEGEQDAN